jgi:hypothetical protein
MGSGTITRLSDGGYVIAYSMGLNGGRNADPALLRLDEHGEELWHLQIEGESYHAGNSLALAEDSGYYMFGLEASAFGEPFDFILTKTSRDPLSAPLPRGHLYPSSQVLISAFPNPFNSSTSIDIQIPYSGMGTIRLLDLNGRVWLSDRWLLTASSVNRLRLFSTDLPSGSYFLNLSVDGEEIYGRLLTVNK